VLPHGLGIALSVAVLLAVFGVSSRYSLKALAWLRLILWISVIKILVVQLWLISKGEPELAAYVRGILLTFAALLLLGAIRLWCVLPALR
jgi:hypothetical protein